MHGVELPAPFDPPVMAAGIAAADDPLDRDRRLRNILGKRGRHEFYRMSGILRIEQQRAAERHIVRRLRRPFFPYSSRASRPSRYFAPPGIRPARPRAIQEHGTLKPDASLLSPSSNR